MTDEELRNLEDPNFNEKEKKKIREKRKEETDKLYKYFKSEMSHLAVSVRDLSDKYSCLDHVFRSFHGVMESWLWEYEKKRPNEAAQIRLDELRNDEELNKQPKIKEMLIAYTKVRQADLNNKIEDPAGNYGLDKDTTVTEQQKEGLRTFHRWLQKHCDTAGIQKKGFGSNGPVRNYAEEFMKLPARVQLKALFLLETGKRKDPKETADNRDSQNDSYVPNMKDIRSTMVASKFKFFKRFNGGQFYWSKLQDAVEIAKESEESLKAYSDELKALQNTGKVLDKNEKEQAGKKVFAPQNGETEAEIEKQSKRKEKHSWSFWGAMLDKFETWSGYAEEVESHRELADGAHAIRLKNAEEVINKNTGKVVSVAAGAAAAVSVASGIAELGSQWSLLKKKDVLGKFVELGGSLSDLGSTGADIAKSVVGVGGDALEVVGGGLAVASGAALMLKNGIDLYGEHKNGLKVEKVLSQMNDLKKNLEAEKTKLEKDQRDFNSQKNTYDKNLREQKEKELHDRNVQYEMDKENLRKIEQIAKLSQGDIARNKTRGVFGLVEGGLLTGSGSVALAATAGAIAPIAGPIAVVAGVSSGIAIGAVQAVMNDKQRVDQNRQYIDSDMYQSDRDRREKEKNAQENLKIGQELFEAESEEWKKAKQMYENSTQDPETFRDQIRDLYVAKQGYIHQTAGKEGIKDKLFGEVYDEVYEKAEPQDKNSLQGKIRTSFQDLLRSEGIQVRHTAERRKQYGASKDKVLDQIRER